MSRPAAELRSQDPYAFMALLGKKVLHPGGRASTDRLLAIAAITPGERVLDIGCGAGTTAIRVASEHGAHVVAADIDEGMRARARRNVAAAGFRDSIAVEHADIESLPFADDSFDVVIAEGVSSFVDRQRSSAELARVTRPGGWVLSTDFSWLREPTDEVRDILLGDVCQHIHLDSPDGWADLRSAAGLVVAAIESGAFRGLTPRGLLADEGVGTALVFARALARPAYRRHMTWLLPRMLRVAPYLGYVTVGARRPEPETAWLVPTSWRSRTKGSATPHTCWISATGAH